MFKRSIASEGITLFEKSTTQGKHHDIRDFPLGLRFKIYICVQAIRREIQRRFSKGILI